MLHARDHVVLAAMLCVLAAGCAKPRAVETTQPMTPPPSAAATAPPAPPAPPPPAAPATEAPAAVPPPVAEKPAAPAPAAPAAPAATAPAPAPPPPAPAPAPRAPEPKSLYIRTAFANFRAEPGLKGKVLTTLKKGTHLTVLEEKDQWYRVKLDSGREGWVAESVAGPEK